MRIHTYGLYIWNFGTSDLPPQDTLLVSNNHISEKSEQDIWIVP